MPMRSSIGFHLTRRALAAALLAALPGLPALARGQSANAYSLSDITDLVKNKVPSKRVLSLANAALGVVSTASLSGLHAGDPPAITRVGPPPSSGQSVAALSPAAVRIERPSGLNAAAWTL